MSFWDFIEDSTDEENQESNFGQISQSLIFTLNKVWGSVWFRPRWCWSCHHLLMHRTLLLLSSSSNSAQMCYSPIVAAWSGSNVSSVNLRRRLLTGNVINSNKIHYASLSKTAKCFIPVTLLHTGWASFCCETSFPFRSCGTRLIKDCISVSF